ncbi:replication protein VP4 [Microviridae Bog1249_12]|uniref:replication protein VP4 n=1 Tax=Microviridae Bog1249_12 TaxID=1655647 RepID=UPI00063D5B82|nr:replication protein VP4 [Microviridae Bog1249_12]AKI26875.1 replication protein VP4 [Microviridae Bog1249_12]AKI26918.1 replication protein VP4 [Microviridae Fen51_42]
MCPYPFYLKKYNIFVPCGKCGSCLKRKISDWTIRLQNEFKRSKTSAFLTLTYQEAPDQLDKTHLQKFFRRLRKKGVNFSYFALGDYGDTFGRPHYHVLAFERTSYLRDVLNQSWRSGKDEVLMGFTHYKPMSFGRIHYVVKYGLLAKLDWNKEQETRKPPFFLMSQSIGSCYLTDDILDYHKKRGVWHYQDGRYKKPLPRYYRDKLFTAAYRQIHNLKYQAIVDEQYDLKRVYFASQGFHDEIDQKIYEQITATADNYLKELRKQKQLKVKILKN